jgi:hypothetical protein
MSLFLNPFPGLRAALVLGQEVVVQGMCGLLPADFRQVPTDLPCIIHSAYPETFAAIRALEQVAFFCKRNIKTFVLSIYDQVGGE